MYVLQYVQRALMLGGFGCAAFRAVARAGCAQVYCMRDRMGVGVHDGGARIRQMRGRARGRVRRCARVFWVYAH